MTATAPPEAAHELPEREFRSVLNSLYDPAVLRASPLGAMLGVADRPDAASALRGILTEAIERLRPPSTAPSDTRTWRVYQVLRRRFTEQLTQREVAADLGLSIRQIQREERLARQVLADHLLARFAIRVVPEKTVDAGRQPDPRLGSGGSMPTRAEELARLDHAVPVEGVSVARFLPEVLDTARPLLEASHTSLSLTTFTDVPRVQLRTSLVRQALLNLLAAAASCVPGGRIDVGCTTGEGGLTFSICGWAAEDEAVGGPEPSRECLEMAERLVAMCQGEVEVVIDGEDRPDRHQDCHLHATITLPLVDQLPVLVVDDNTDALRLFQRYLSGTRYRFVGASDAQKGLALAQEIRLCAVVLDVMMPDSDGWTMLGALREHPDTRGVPVIVCTILSQQDLALALGAADFVRKPVSRAALLASLDALNL